MQMYIPSFLNLGGALASPYLNYILEASISEYNTDFYSRHLVGIPLMVRMGSDGKLRTFQRTNYHWHERQMIMFLLITCEEW